MKAPPERGNVATASHRRMTLLMLLTLIGHVVLRSHEFLNPPVLRAASVGSLTLHSTILVSEQLPERCHIEPATGHPARSDPPRSAAGGPACSIERSEIETAPPAPTAARTGPTSRKRPPAGRPGRATARGTTTGRTAPTTRCGAVGGGRRETTVSRRSTRPRARSLDGLSAIRERPCRLHRPP